LEAAKGEPIKEAADQLDILISDEEIHAWKELRDRVTHGGLKTGAEAIPSLSEWEHWYDCCENIINKLVLGLIGFKGTIVDYSKIGYPKTNFP
jgi:hypothetical protein